MRLVRLQQITRLLGVGAVTLGFVLAGALPITAAAAAKAAKTSESGCVPSVTGTIMTTDPFGAMVNGNIYDKTASVYLGGGSILAKLRGHGTVTRKVPAGIAHDGLPDGDYYFQVTDPAGKKLYTRDAVANRKFRVAGGYIQAGLGSRDAILPGDPYPEDFTIIQLMPYLPTDNAGGEYKVWATPVTAYRPDLGSFGFIPSCSATDNFKVRSRSASGGNGNGGGGGKLTALLSGTSFLDLNLKDGWEPQGTPPEPAAAGVRITVYEADGTTVAGFTDSGAFGQWSLQVSPAALPAAYRVTASVLGDSRDPRFAPTTPPELVVGLTAPGQFVEELDFGVVGIGGTGANMRFSPDYFGVSGSQGQRILEALSPAARAAVLAAAIQATAGGCTLPADASPTQFAVALNANLDSGDPRCRLAAYWLSLSLSIAANALQTDAVPEGEIVNGLDGSETVYVGVGPDGTPVFAALRALLGLAAGATDPLDIAFYLAALEWAAGGLSFVLPEVGGGGSGT